MGLHPIPRAYSPHFVGSPVKTMFFSKARGVHSPGLVLMFPHSRRRSFIRVAS